jgi:hypothetical protein
MMTRIGTILVLAAAALAACAAPVVDEDSPRARLPVGSVVVLHQDLVVPDGHARVFLQGGAVVEKHRLKAYHPHCNFEQQAVSDGKAVIAADRFTVSAVSVGEDYVVQRGGLIHAAQRMVTDDSHVGMVNRYVRHRLESARQPQVLVLTCHGGFDFPGRAELPSPADIRAVLGTLAAVES